MEMSMRVNGLMIKLMDMEFIVIMMVQNMKVIGLMINRKVKEKKFGLMVLSILETIMMGKSVEMEDLFGQMDQCMKVNLEIII
jgi:hypothetical protein